MSDLETLIEAVETGREPTGLDVHKADTGHSDHIALVINAFKGDLNAAKALHEALLGDGYIGDGWNYCIWGSGKASVWHIVSNQSFSADVPEREYHAQSPARAWLLAVLRAYAAQQGPTP